MSVGASGFEPLEPSLDRTPEQGRFKTRSVGGRHDRLVGFIQQTGD